MWIIFITFSPSGWALHMAKQIQEQRRTWVIPKCTNNNPKPATGQEEMMEWHVQGSWQRDLAALDILASPGRMLTTQSSWHSLIDMHGCFFTEILFVNWHSNEDLGKIIHVLLLVHIYFCQCGPRPHWYTIIRLIPTIVLWYKWGR